MMTESFADYSGLSYHLWFLRGCKTSVQSPVGFRVSVEKTDLPLYATWPFSLVAFNTLSLFYRFCVSITMWWEEFPFWSNLIGVL